MRSKIAGSPIETHKSGHVRVREALRVRLLNKWVEVEQTVGELRIRLGEGRLSLSVQPLGDFSSPYP